MKLEVKYLFPTSSSGANFYIYYQLSEGLGMGKHLHMVLGRKRIHKSGRKLSGISSIQ